MKKAIIVTLVSMFLMLPANISVLALPNNNNNNTCGCYDAFGNCVIGTFSNACGHGGGICIDCTASGQFCDSSQTCLLCDSESCPGCCDGNGECQTGTKRDKCGTGGAVCQNCALNNLGCVNNQCQPCNPSTCLYGCCDSWGNCVPGTSLSACGKNGNICEWCADGKACYLQQCQACNAQTCSLGCCDVIGGCRDGTSTAFCGPLGGTCQQCATGQTCLNSQCVTCNATTCPDGCCHSTYGCLKYSSQANYSCGTGGAQCADCGSVPNPVFGPPLAWAKLCINGQCQVCSQTNCPNGCCDPLNGSCRSGQHNEACGGSGSVCKNCTDNGQYCSNRVCKDLPPPT